MAGIIVCQYLWGLNAMEVENGKEEEMDLSQRFGSNELICAT